MKDMVQHFLQSIIIMKLKIKLEKEFFCQWNFCIYVLVLNFKDFQEVIDCNKKDCKSIVWLMFNFTYITVILIITIPNTLYNYLFVKKTAKYINQAYFQTLIIDETIEIWK